MAKSKTKPTKFHKTFRISPKGADRLAQLTELYEMSEGEAIETAISALWAAERDAGNIADPAARAALARLAVPGPDEIEGETR